MMPTQAELAIARNQIPVFGLGRSRFIFWDGSALKQYQDQDGHVWYLAVECLDVRQEGRS